MSSFTEQVYEELVNISKGNKIQVCDVVDFSDLSKKVKESRSPSEVLFAKLIEKKLTNPSLPIAMKVFIDTRNSDLYDQDNGDVKDLNEGVRGLSYEIQVYLQIINSILRNRFSPNFVPGYAFGRCGMNSKLLSTYDRLQRLLGRFNKDLPLKQTE